MRIEADTVEQWLDRVPPEHSLAMRALVALVRGTVSGATEDLRYGMPTWSFDEAFCAVAVQRHHLALYVMDTECVAAHREHLKSAKLGKSCIRFKSLESIDLDALRAVLRMALDRRT